MRSTRRRTTGAVAALLVTMAVVASACVVEPGDPGPADVILTVDSTLDRRPISPLIYGTNGTRDLAANRQTLVRLGGNRWTAYNWENNASNAGSDWCFQNDGFLSESNVPGEAVRVTVAQAHAAGAAAMVTLPNVDHVAADKNGGCDVRNSGPNYLDTRFRDNVADKPGPLTTSPNTGDGAVYQEEFVNWLRQAVPGADISFSLDNEPDLWSHTHAEVHPNPVTYSELGDRNAQFAAAAKSVWPEADVVGPVNYGFNGFETLQNAPDAGAHGNFLDWWLERMEAAAATAGRRLVDHLDIHWYPEARGGGVRITGTETGSAVAAARVQAPRSLWDPSYVETSWISQDYGYGAIRLLPRMRERIAARYPGTGLAITEWNYGGGQHISGAIATADVLGTFGREGVSMACLWELNADERFTYAGFRAFRNYDGAGGEFEDTSIRATSSDIPTATVYASVDAADRTKMVIVAINKSTTAKTASLKVRHTAKFTSADVYRVTSAASTPQAAGSISTSATNAWLYTMPPMSVSIIVPEA
jgi:hypothetical protein